MRIRLHSAGIAWTALKYHKAPSVISTALDIVIGLVLALYVSSKRRPQIVHARSYIPALIALVLKSLTGARFVFDMRGFWADERVDGGLWSLNKPIFKQVYRYFKRKELEFFKNADYTVSLTHNGRNEILNWPKRPA